MSMGQNCLKTSPIARYQGKMVRELMVRFLIKQYGSYEY